MKCQSILFTCSITLLVAACTSLPVQIPEAPTDNNLLKTWQGPYGGVPAFDQMQLADLKPALEEAMAENLVDIEAIAANPEAANFDNTILAMERSGPKLGRIFSYYGIWRSNVSSPEFREIQKEMAPVLSAYFSSITQNEDLLRELKKSTRIV